MGGRSNMNIMHLISVYADLVDMQSNEIDHLTRANKQLFDLLHQYMTLEELDGLEAIKDINKAAAIRECVDRKKSEVGCAP